MEEADRASAFLVYRDTCMTRKTTLLFILLVTCLASFYMLTYSGQIEIADQLEYFDATSSLATFGDLKYDLTMWQPNTMPSNFPRRQPDPLRISQAEPGLLIAGAPLYLLAEHLPGIGLVHTVYLLNVIVTAALCGIFFLFALQLGYSQKTALIGAVSLGLLTILLPYSQTYFREQLMMVFLLLATVALERWRNYRNVLLPLLAVIFLIAAFRTKEGVILALPGLLMLMLPETFWKNRLVQRVSDGLLVALLVVSVLIAFTDVLKWMYPSGEPIPLVGAFVLETEFTRTALHTYLFSPGGSLWGTSPILLLALPGAWLLWRAGNRRLLWMSALMVLVYAFGYALLRGEEWFGGTIWPQRFLMPALPFAMLPLLQWMTKASRRGWIVFAALALYSAWWQFSGVAFRWETYSRATFDLSNGGLVYWGPGFNDLRYIRPVVLTGLIGQEPLNFAWARTGQWGLPLLWLALVVLCAWSIRKSLVDRVGRLLPVGLAAGFMLLTYLTLRLIYIDPAYDGENTALHEMVEVIRRDVAAGEYVMLADREYNDFFLNYGKVGQRRLIGFPFHPGDRGSCEQELLVESDNPEDLLAENSARIVRSLARVQPRLWLLVSSGPEIPCVVRPMERLMGMDYYRVSERETAPAVRLVEYQTTQAPDAFSDEVAELVPVDLHYAAMEGGVLDLTGVLLPMGKRYQPGDWLPISLQWRSEDEITRVYTVAWFVVDSGGVKAQGEDTWHGATFFPTTLWKPGAAVWDNRALRLPDDLPPGQYQLWVKVYWQDVHTGAITDLLVSGEMVNGEVIGVLPVTIELQLNGD
jgi:hypothetical protein